MFNEGMDKNLKRVEEVIKGKLDEVGLQYRENEDIPSIFKKALFNCVITLGDEAAKLEEGGFKVDNTINFVEYDNSYNVLMWCLVTCRDFITANISALEEAKQQLDDEFLQHH